jgi:trimeric autotransporter adhesin
MKRFVTALAVVLTAIFAAAGCNDYGNTFQSNTGAQIFTLSPSNITAGSPAFTLTINGNGFVTQTFITWNGMRLATSDILDSAGDVLQVTATVPASLVTKPGQALILTHNPFSGAGNNGLSNPLNFIINPANSPNPTPLLQSISPTNATLGAVPTGGITLTLTGSNFVISSDPTQSASVIWNSGTTTMAPANTTLSVLPGTTPTPTQIVVNVPQALLGAAGAANVTVMNPPNSAGTPPAGGGGLSSPLAFTVVAPNPVPALSSINPASTAAGSAAFTVTLTGTNFVTNSDPTQAASVSWVSGTTTTPLTLMAAPTATQIVANIPAALVATAGTASIFVTNPPNRFATPPGGGGGNSGLLPFTITAAPTGSVAKAQAAAEETPAVSADGRYVAFTGMSGQNTAIFLRDTCEGAHAGCQPQTTLLSSGPDGAAANEDSHTPSMSADARYVAFASAASNLLSTASPSSAATAATSSATSPESSAVPGPGRQIYLRDTCIGAPAGCAPTTQLISTDPGGQLVGTEGILPSVSASGRFVAFVAVTQSKSSGGAASATSSNTATAGTSAASNSAQSSTANNSGYRQVFVRDTCLGATSCTAKTTRISLQPGDGTENAPAATPAGPALSGDAKKIALTGGGTAVLFMRSVAVDDRIFVAALDQSR